MNCKEWQCMFVTSVKDGRLVMHANTEAAALPWLRMLERAGVSIERADNGAYVFTLDDHPELIEARP